MDELKSLREKIIRLGRKAGVFHLLKSDLTEFDTRQIPTLLDSFVTRFGFLGINDRWNEIEFLNARRIMFRIVRTDLAYDLPQVPEEVANTLVEEIIKTLDADVGSRYFTNGEYYKPISRAPGIGPSWQPITNATFDSGVVVLADQSIGLVWVEDED